MNEIRIKFQNRYRLSKEIIPLLWVGIHVFANGFVSFLVIAVGTRKLQTLDLKNFLVTWNILNVSLVVLLSPMESLAPKLLSDYGKAKENLTVMKKQAIGSAVIILIIAILAKSGNIIVLKISDVFAIALFVYSAQKTYVVRSVFMAQGLYQLIAMLSLLSSFSTYVMFQILYLSDQISVTSIFASISVGAIIGTSFAKRNMLAATNKFDSEEIDRKYQIKRNVHKRLFQLSATAFVQLGLGMTGVTVLRFVGGTKSDMVMYASLAGLCSIFFGFVNSASVPMSKSVALTVVSGDLLDLKTIFIKNTSIYTLGLFLTMLFAVVSADTYLEVITGTQIETPKTRIVLTVLAIGAECIIVVPKIILIGIGHERKIMYIWLSGILVYVTSLFLPIGPYERVCSAVFVSALYIFCVSSISALSDIDKAKIDLKVQNDER